MEGKRGGGMEGDGDGDMTVMTSHCVCSGTLLESLKNS